MFSFCFKGVVRLQFNVILFVYLFGFSAVKETDKQSQMRRRCTSPDISNMLQSIQLSQQQNTISSVLADMRYTIIKQHDQFAGVSFSAGQWANGLAVRMISFTCSVQNILLAMNTSYSPTKNINKTSECRGLCQVKRFKCTYIISGNCLLWFPQNEGTRKVDSPHPPNCQPARSRQHKIGLCRGERHGGTTMSMKPTAVYSLTVFFHTLSTICCYPLSLLRKVMHFESGLFSTGTLYITQRPCLIHASSGLLIELSYSSCFSLMWFITMTFALFQWYTTHSSLQLLFLT